MKIWYFKISFFYVGSRFSLVFDSATPPSVSAVTLLPCRYVGSRFSLVFDSATPPSVSAVTLLPKKNCQFPENSGVLFGVGVLHVRWPNDPPTLKKGQVDVFSLVFVRAAPPTVTALTPLRKNKIGAFRKIQMCIFGLTHYICADPNTFRQATTNVI